MHRLYLERLILVSKLFLQPYCVIRKRLVLAQYIIITYDEHKQEHIVPMITQQTVFTTIGHRTVHFYE